jgi:osmotically-inducible protein OsmY
MRRLFLGVATFALATMTLSWALAGDQDIAKQITERLKQEQDAGNLRGFNINLKVAEGSVRLEGQVSSEEQQRLVTSTARQVEGVKNIINDLVIQAEETAQEASPAAASAKPAAVDDAAIAAQIARNLSEKKDAGLLKGFSVDVQVKNGEVTMKGAVTSLEQRALALQAAESVTGVTSVLNQLTVKSSQVEVALKAAPADQQPLAKATTIAKYEAKPAEEDVRNAVYQSQQTEAARRENDRLIGETLTQALQEAEGRGYLQDFGLGVHVDNGYAWLKGEVRSEEQQNMVLEIARRIPGVRQVINDITIVPAPAAGQDSEQTLLAIAQEIGQRLQTAESLGSLRGANLDVRVESDMVLLTGVVANAEQQQLAVELARGVSGSGNVRSQLRIEPSVQEATFVLASDARMAAPGPQPPMEINSVPMPVNMSVAQPQFMVDAPQGMLAPQDTQYIAMNEMPRPLGATRLASYAGAAIAAPVAIMGQAAGMEGMYPAHLPGPGYSQVPARYDHPNLPGYAWPSYAAHPNYAAVTYPKQYSPTAWPYIGPFYPYPQVPLGWRKVTLKWDDGWWQLDFKAK